MAVPDWYIEWTSSHRTAFGLTAESWEDAMAIWWVGFNYLHFTEEELREATARMIREANTPKFESGHLDAIKRHVTAQRAERRHVLSDQARYEAPGGYVPCSLCNDCGMVNVPDPKDVDANTREWLPPSPAKSDIRREIVVTCTCARGRALYDDLCSYAMQKHMPEHLSLERYQLVNPGWRKQVADWQSYRSHATMNAATESNDWHGIVRRLIDRLRKNPA